MKVFLTTLFFIFLSMVIMEGNSQTQVSSSKLQVDSLILENGIPDYDKYCSVMGGDSVFYDRGMKFTGQYKDYWPNKKIKHNGFYDQGKISSVFTNYFPDGKIERKFKPKGVNNGQLTVYYHDGSIKSQVDYINGNSVKWSDYYPNGQLEFAEEFDKNIDYYLYMRFYFEDGKPQILFELTDDKQRIYRHTEYYANGKIKEEGNKIQNRVLNDYRQDGLWKYYNEEGKLTMEEEYVRGDLIKDKYY